METYWSEKSDMERAVVTGLFGAPELKRGERNQCLGEFEERVLAVLPLGAVAEAEVDSRVKKAAQDPRARAIIVRGDVPYDDAHKYARLAKEHGLTFTMRDDPAYGGDAGLVVVSDKALH